VLDVIQLTAEFNGDRPSYAFVSVGSPGIVDDPQKMDRKLIYRTTESVKTAEISGTVEKEPLDGSMKWIGIVNRWKKHRTPKDRVYASAYIDLVKEGFPSAKSTRVIYVDGKPVAFNAGWEVPNVQGRYYAAIGIHDYSNEALGEMMNLEDLSIL